LEKSNFPKAINAYERVLSIDPKNADAYYNMGVALFQNGDQQQAIGAFQNAARNGSRDAQTWLNANKLTW
ncbi:MAG: tetratricopeptide repeat protein, partial [Bacteroidales bacterium]|nr:tetratricopeptide repeat protein [Bacteroidales bacterium]